jgi:tripartite-type tricarboxylate transporter receptor subunit TctC
MHVNDISNSLIVLADAPYNNIAEFVEYAKQIPASSSLAHSLMVCLLSRPFDV